MLSTLFVAEERKEDDSECFLDLVAFCMYILVYLYALLNRVFRETCRQKKDLPIGGVAQSFFKVETFY